MPENGQLSRVDTLGRCWLCDAPEFYHHECPFFPCRCRDGEQPCAWCVAFSAAVRANGTAEERRAIVRALAAEYAEYWPPAHTRGDA